MRKINLKNNPLLDKSLILQFEKIKPKHVTPAIDFILLRNRAKISQLLDQKRSYNWANLLKPLEEINDQLHQVWGTIQHFNYVNNSPQIRKAHDENIAKITSYFSELGQNTKLFDAIQAIKKSKNYTKLSATQKKILNDNLRDFKLAGVALPEKGKKVFVELRNDLALLQSRFSNNVLDATYNWSYHVKNKKLLQGLPNHIVKTARSNALSQKKSGWLLTLDQPCYVAVMTYAKSRMLRKKIYWAYATRASDQGPNAGKWDNEKIMYDILKKRNSLAKLIKFDNYAKLSLATKMANTCPQVINFLKKISGHSRKKALLESEELITFARKLDNIKDFNAWDLGYYSEKLRQDKFQISQQEIRQYFPEKKVLSGMFKLAKQLFEINIKPVKNMPSWHKDVKIYAIYKNKKLCSYLYLDLYSRSGKQNGAWMNDYQTRRKLSSKQTQQPVAFIVCNFTPPNKKDPALFTHNEVITLFHEFGHSLQHMLTTINYAEAAGINGIPWDAVEIASQFMENWCWQYPVIKTISKELPKILFNRMIAAKNSYSGIQMLRQMEFALFDFELHMQKNIRKSTQIQTILNTVRKQLCVLDTPLFNRFQNSFSHIFAGGYAAGYYSYAWADVLAADVFAKFEGHGLVNKKIGHEFMKCFLEPGGSITPLQAFKKFRGRTPSIRPLLVTLGLDN